MGGRAAGGGRSQCCRHQDVHGQRLGAYTRGLTLLDVLERLHRGLQGPPGGVHDARARLLVSKAMLGPKSCLEKITRKVNAGSGPEQGGQGAGRQQGAQWQILELWRETCLGRGGLLQRGLGRL